MNRTTLQFDLQALQANYEDLVVVSNASDTVDISNWTAGENLSGHRIVYASSATDVKYADKDTPAQASLIIGVTTQASSLSDVIAVQTRGLLKEDSWDWTPGLPIFLGNDGMMTQDIPTTGFMLEIGVAVEPTSIYVFIRIPVLI